MNHFGVTRQFVENLGLTDARQIGSIIAQQIRSGMEPLFPKADPGLLGVARANEINLLISQQLAAFELSLADLLRQGIAGALGNAGTVYEKILEVAYTGVPCPDATVKLTGTFSHAAVSAALSATVGTVLSTAGAAGMVGSINVLGVPVGRTRSFVAGTDRQGDPNPSFCGETLLAIGPLEFGQMKSLYECPGCITGLLSSFGQLTGCLAEDTIRAILARVAPQHLNQATPQALAALNDSEKMAFIGQIFSMPPVPGLGDCFINAARTAVDSFNPFFTLCGQATPKLFGIPLSAEVVEVNASATRTNLAASFSFSPSYIINNLMLCAGTVGLFCQPIFPALESATMGFGLGFPDVGKSVVAGLEGKLNSPQAVANYAKEGFDHMLANATYTIGYEINPFGFKLADAEARVMLPNLTEHPARPGFTYVRPEDRGQGLPSRLTVALTALEAGFLANPLWKGTAQDLPQIFPQGSPERAQLQESGLSFQKDYFPHGGILGAGRLSMPKLIVDAPPATLQTLLDPTQDVFARLGAAADVIGNYLLQTSEVGSLAFYVPAPNPPLFNDGQGNPLTPEKLLTAMQTFDVSMIGLPSLYPLEQFFFSGYMEGRLIGVPIARAGIVAVPASGNGGAFFRVSAGVPDTSWLRAFVENASLTFEIRQSPPLAIEDLFSDLMQEVNALSQPGASATAVARLVNETGNRLADALPKVSLDLTVNNFRIPDPLTNLLTSANATTRLVAYSPRFNPDFTGEGPVAEVTRRGGIAFHGQFRFANLVTVNDAQLAVFPTGPAALPGLAGRFRVAQLGIPGAALHDALFDFNSAPAAGQPFLAASGGIDPIRIDNPLNGQRLLSLVPLSAGSNRISARFELAEAQNKIIQASFRVDSAKVDMPMLGPGLSMRIHGASPNDPFSFSTTGPWGASVTIEGQLSIRDLASQEIARLGSSGDSFSARMTGNGLALTSLTISNFPTGLNITTFPGTDFARTLAIGGTSPAQLRINGDGTFEFTAALGGSLNLPNLPAPVLQSGASITVNQSQLRITGSFEGGLLAPGTLAQGDFTVTRHGQVSLSGSAIIPPQAFGSILIRGVASENLPVQLFHDGYAAPAGARLQIVGLNNDLLSLSPFTNRANLDFTAAVISGNFTVPNFFRMSGGTMRFLRRSGVVTFQVHSPSVTLLPGSQQENVIQAPFTNLVVSTDGQFYADTGTRDLHLLGGLKLHGRMELGNQPGTAQPELTITPASLNFGTIDFGTVSNRTIRFSNTGESPLMVGLASSTSSFIPAQADLSIPVGEFREVSVQFRPAAGGTTTGQIQVFMTPGGQQPSVSVNGIARPVPVFNTSDSTLFFGEAPLGSVRTRKLVVRNLGLVPLTLTSASLTGPFTLTPVINNRMLQTNEAAELIVTFTPVAVGATNGVLAILANDNPAPHPITLETGNAYVERLVRLREGGPTLRAITMLSTNTGWAVGDEGVVLRTENGGRSWSPARLGFSGSFRAIAARNTTLAIAGLDGIAGLSTDGGNTWRRLTAPILSSPSNHWHGLSFVPLNVFNPNNINSGARLVLVGAHSEGGGIIAREDGGAFVQALATTSALHAVDSHQSSPTVPARIIAVGDSGLVVKSSDAGANWIASTAAGGFSNLRSVAFGSVSLTPAPPGVWVAGDRGLLLTASSFEASLARVVSPTLEDFTTVRVGYIAGANGSAYTRLPFSSNVPFVSESPSGAYDFTSQSANAAGAWLVGQLGQIYVRPPTAPAGPILTFSPGAADFGLLPLNRMRSIEVTVVNRGFAPLNVGSLSLSGSSAFSLSTNQLLNIGTNSSKAFLVRFTPTVQGEHIAVIEISHNESTTKYHLAITGRGQANTWNPIASPVAESLRDLQFVSDTTGFAMTLNDLFKTTNGGVSWNPLPVDPPGNLSRLQFLNSALGFAFGGGSSVRFQSCTGSCASFVLRTADGGNTWATRNTGVSTPVDDLHMVSTTTGYAVTRSLSLLGIGPRITPGDVLRTANSGLTWTVLPRPQTPSGAAFSGSAVHAVSSTIVFVAGNGELFRSTDSGQNWTRVLNLGGSTIEDLQFVDASTGWLVGQNGLFRWTTTGGAVSTAWTPQTPFTGSHLKRVHFINTMTGWITGDDGASGSIFRTDNGGVTWVEEYREGTTAGSLGPSAVSGRSATVAFAASGPGIYRTSLFNPPPQGSPILPALVDFGVISFGTNVTRTLTLRNVGSGTVNVTALTMDHDSEAEAFQLLTEVPISVPANSSRLIEVRYAPSAVARHHARLQAVTDGHEGALVCDLVGAAEVFPTSILVATEPPGLQIAIDGRSVRGPVAITVVGESKVPNDVINPFQWRFGTTHTLSAPASQDKDGYEYQLQGWEPAQPETFSVLATNQPATYRAVYVPIKTVNPAVAGFVPGAQVRRAAQRDLQTSPAPPSDIPGGPYIRISNANLDIPALGSLGVQGSAFLSSDRFEFALASDSIGNPQLLSVDAGSWRVSYTNNVRFVLRAQNPGVRLLNKPVTGSSQVLFEVDPSRIVAQFTAASATPFIPAVAELGPNASIFFTNRVSGNTRFSSLRANGQLRLLARPGGGFAINQPVDFLASDGPFTNTINAFPATLLDTPLLRMTPRAGARLEISRNAQGSYGVSLANLNLSLLGGANTPVSATLAGTKMNFTAAGDLAFGSLRYDAESASSIEWNFVGPSIKAILAPGVLLVPGINPGIHFDGLTLDSNANFDRKIRLPALTFDSININGGGSIDHNFVRFFRQNGVTKFQFRDRRSFFDNTFKLAIDISSSGAASGSFSGNLSIKDAFGCEEIGFGQMNMSYNSAFNDFQFRGDVKLETCVLGTHDFRIKFGSDGGRICHMICNNNGCTEDLCIP